VLIRRFKHKRQFKIIYIGRGGSHLRAWPECDEGPCAQGEGRGEQWAGVWRREIEGVRRGGFAQASNAGHRQKSETNTGEKTVQSRYTKNGSQTGTQKNGVDHNGAVMNTGFIKKVNEKSLLIIRGFRKL